MKKIINFIGSLMVLAGFCLLAYRDQEMPGKYLLALLARRALPSVFAKKVDRFFQSEKEKQFLIPPFLHPYQTELEHPLEHSPPCSLGPGWKIAPDRDTVFVRLFE